MVDAKVTRVTPGKLEFTLACLAVVLISGAFTFLLFTDMQKFEHSATAASGQLPTISHPAISSAFIAVYLFAGLRVLSRFRAVLDLAVRDKYLASLLLLAAISALWSVDPRLTVLKVIGLVGTTLLGVYLAAFYSLRQQLTLLGAAAGVFALGSIIVVMAWPEHGVMAGVHGGRWNGAFTHKNHLGIVATLSALNTFYLATLAPSRTWWQWLVFTLSLALVILSGGKSAMITAMIVFFILTGCALVCRERAAACTAMSAAVVVTAFLVLQIQGKGPLEQQAVGQAESAPLEQKAVGQAEGAPPLEQKAVGQADSGRLLTLTGRVPLWRRLGDFAVAEPWLGYGYGVFWVRDAGPFGDADEKLGWWPGQAHNGYLDIQLSLGLAGTLLFAALLAKSGAMSFHTISSEQQRFHAYYYPLLIVACSVLNFSESLFLLPNRLPWVLTVMAYCSLLLLSSDKYMPESSKR